MGVFVVSSSEQIFSASYKLCPFNNLTLLVLLALLRIYCHSGPHYDRACSHYPAQDRSHSHWQISFSSDDFFPRRSHRLSILRCSRTAPARTTSLLWNSRRVDGVVWCSCRCTCLAQVFCSGDLSLSFLFLKINSTGGTFTLLVERIIHQNICVCFLSILYIKA